MGNGPETIGFLARREGNCAVDWENKGLRANGLKQPNPRKPAMVSDRSNAFT